jgi:hypothetical protein
MVYSTDEEVTKKLGIDLQLALIASGNVALANSALKLSMQLITTAKERDAYALFISSLTEMLTTRQTQEKILTTIESSLSSLTSIIASISD